MDSCVNNSEKILMGCMMLENELIPTILNEVKIDDLENKDCKIIYETICDLYHENEKVNIG